MDIRAPKAGNKRVKRLKDNHISARSQFIFFFTIYHVAIVVIVAMSVATIPRKATRPFKKARVGVSLPALPTSL